MAVATSGAGTALPKDHILAALLKTVEDVFDKPLYR